jgi:hypothetical protein
LPFLSPVTPKLTHTLPISKNERCSGHITRGATRVHRELIRCGAQRRAARHTAAPDQTASARRRDVRGFPRRGRVGERIRLVPVQRTARRARARGALYG